MGITNVLPQLMANSKIWNNLFEVADEVVADTADARIEKLMRRFDIDWMTRRQSGVSQLTVEETNESRVMLYALAKTLGYNLRDRGKLSLSTFARYVEESTAFIPYNGTAHFINFFSYILDNKVNVQMLWYDNATSSYYSEQDAFLTGKRFGVDGFNDAIHTAYPLPYVRLTFEQGAIQNLGYTVPELQDLFYSIAPADILIHEISVDVGLPVTKIRVGVENTQITVRPIIIESDDTGPIFVF